MIQCAKQIFLKGLKDEPSILAGFFKKVTFGKKPEKLTIRVGARGYYRLYINGKFASLGPARAEHGYLRIDEFDIAKFVEEGENTFAFEIMGYNMKENSFLTYEYSVLIAEAEADGNIVLATDASWNGGRIYHKQLNIEPLSFGRRAPGEYYILDDEFKLWKTKGFSVPFEVVEITAPVTFLPRGTLMPDLTVVRFGKPMGIYSMGPYNYPKFPEKLWWETNEYTSRAASHG
ncbi:MAG: hypothetical protein LBI03_05335, partial [Clostridiales bacterium]|nr:hypothetical protein [Clostridiales bacterium]